MDKKNNSLVFPIIVVIFLATVLAYLVSIYAKNRSDLSKSITPEQLASFTLDTVEYNPPVDLSKQMPSTLPVENKGSRTAYANISNIKVATIENITMLTAEDLQNIGATPWSLSNTIKENVEYPQVLEIVFNNQDVINAFLERKDIKPLLTDPNQIISLISSNDSSVVEFVQGVVFQMVINNEGLLFNLSNSALMQSVLNSPSSQYFLANPQEAGQLVKGNNALTSILTNENLKQLLFSNPNTNGLAKEIYSK